MILATIENMRTYQGPEVAAYSPSTGEIASADPQLYSILGLAEDEALLDDNNNPMILVPKGLI